MNEIHNSDPLDVNDKRDLFAEGRRVMEMWILLVFVSRLLIIFYNMNILCKTHPVYSPNKFPWPRSGIVGRSWGIDQHWLFYLMYFSWLVISLSICFLLQSDGIVSEMETEFLTSQLWASEVIIEYLSTLLSRALCFLKLPCSAALWRYSRSELSREPFCYHRYLLSLYTTSNSALILHWLLWACWPFQLQLPS